MFFRLDTLMPSAREGPPPVSTARRVGGGGYPLVAVRGQECDLTTAWGLDDDIVDDVIAVFRLAFRVNQYPDTHGHGPQFEALVREWRPELVSA